MKFQRKLSNGSWTDEDRINTFVDMVLEREPWFAPRVNREPMTTREQVLAYLATGQELHWDNDWYAVIRDADALKPRQSKQAEMVTASCGHTIERHLVMSTSTGTSCPDCYDRMSD